MFVNIYSHGQALPRRVLQVLPSSRSNVVQPIESTITRHEGGVPASVLNRRPDNLRRIIPGRSEIFSIRSRGSIARRRVSSTHYFKEGIVDGINS
jgi:hypothetical protein